MALAKRISRMYFKINQHRHVVSLSKSGKKPVSMKVDAFFQLGGTTDVKYVAVLVGENVGVPHTVEYEARAPSRSSDIETIQLMSGKDTAYAWRSLRRYAPRDTSLSVEFLDAQGVKKFAPATNYDV